MKHGKLLFSHGPEGDNYTKIEVFTCPEKPKCQIVAVSDAELGDMHSIHLPVSVRAVLIEVLQS